MRAAARAAGSPSGTAARLAAAAAFVLLAIVCFRAGSFPIETYFSDDKDSPDLFYLGFGGAFWALGALCVVGVALILFPRARMGWIVLALLSIAASVLPYVAVNAIFADAGRRLGDHAFIAWAVLFDRDSGVIGWTNLVAEGGRAWHGYLLQGLLAGIAVLAALELRRIGRGARVSMRT